MKKIGYLILTIFLTVIVIFNICSILDISVFGYRVYRVGSGSMNPVLKVGDYILIGKSNNYKIGDIITYKSKSSYITHRIVYIDGKKIVTKGDSNNIDDEFINKKNIVGKLLLKLRIITFISFLLSIPYTWIFIFLIGIIYIWFFSKYKVKDKKLIDKEVL